MEYTVVVRGTFSLGGRLLSLTDLSSPTMVVTFEHDNIVPQASAVALLEHIGAKTKEHVHLQGGHVGAMTSKKAATALWPRIQRWWIGHPSATELMLRRNKAS